MTKILAYVAQALSISAILTTIPLLILRKNYMLLIFPIVLILLIIFFRFTYYDGYYPHFEFRFR